MQKQAVEFKLLGPENNFLSVAHKENLFTCLFICLLLILT